MQKITADLKNINFIKSFSYQIMFPF